MQIIKFKSTLSEQHCVPTGPEFKTSHLDVNHHRNICIISMTMAMEKCRQLLIDANTYIHGHAVNDSLFHGLHCTGFCVVVVMSFLIL